MQHGRVCRVRSVAGVGGGGVRAQQASAASSKVCFEVADKSGFGCPAMVRRFGALSHTKPTVTREEGACDRGGSQSPPKSGRAGGCAASPRGVKCEKAQRAAPARPARPQYLAARSSRHSRGPGSRRGTGDSHRSRRRRPKAAPAPPSTTRASGLPLGKFRLPLCLASSSFNWLSGPTGPVQVP